MQQRGVAVEVCSWCPWDEFPGFLHDKVDIVLQPSLTESHNLIGIEALLAGCPVVGSRSLRYLPQQWLIDPEDPRAISAKIQEVSGDPTSRELARKLGQSESKRCNDAFIAYVQRLTQEPEPKRSKLRLKRELAA
jgi:glycosyltransferase involved in cell wall biosynthesis